MAERLPRVNAQGANWKVDSKQPDDSQPGETDQLHGYMCNCFGLVVLRMIWWMTAFHISMQFIPCESEDSFKGCTVYFGETAELNLIAIYWISNNRNDQKRCTNTVKLHVQDFSAAKVKGATLKGYVPARCKAGETAVACWLACCIHVFMCFTKKIPQSKNYRKLRT